MGEDTEAVDTEAADHNVEDKNVIDDEDEPPIIPYRETVIEFDHTVTNAFILAYY